MKKNILAKNVVQNTLNFASEQLPFALSELENAIMLQPGDEDNPNVMPRSIHNDGSLYLIGAKGDWTAGFFPGTLWYMYDLSKDAKWEETAMEFTSLLEDRQYITYTHDIGFIMFCSYGNALRLTGNLDYIPILVQSARSLATRFNPVVGAIRSWDHSDDKWAS